MKSQLLLSILLLLFGVGAFANDTLTRRQVYDFAVGDTFDYKVSTYYQVAGPGDVNYWEYERIVIMAVDSSANSDTLFYTRNKNGVMDTIAITDLDSIEFFRYDTLYPSFWSRADSIDSSQQFNGRIRNEVLFTPSPSTKARYEFVEGLGLSYYYSGSMGGCPYNCYNNAKELVYYAKGAEKWGTPYYFLNGSSWTPFIPLPEECAVWTYKVEQGGGEIRYSQLRTGVKINVADSVFVELLYTQTGSVNPDSFIGYFRNDSLNKQVLFRLSMSDIELVWYDCSLLNGQQAGDWHHTVDTVTAGGFLRTRWEQYSGASNVPMGGTVRQYVGGIGSIFSFCASPDCSNVTLTCFNICDSTIYISDSAALCAIPTALNEAFQTVIPFKVFPNPSSSINIGVDESILGTTLTITDLTGRIVAETQLETVNTQLSIETLPNGLYFISVNDSIQPSIQKLLITR